MNQQGAELALVSKHDVGGLEFVRVAVEAGLLDLAWMNRLALLDPLRSDARFETLRRTVRVGVVDAMARDAPLMRRARACKLDA